MSRTIPDPIYGTVEIDSWVEDILRIPQIATERRRLERIKNLGLIHISFPSATHSKWEHHLGMFHLAKQLGIAKEERKRLELICLFGGIGHLPFTFATEEAVLLASRISAAFRRPINIMLNEIGEMCEVVCPTEFRRRFPNVLAAMRPEEFHSWLTAWKLKQLPREVDLGDRTQLVYQRVDPRATLHELYRFLSRLDYVQRDLYYTGLAKFSLSAEGFLRRHKVPSLKELRDTPESHLLEELKSYLADSLYFETKSVTREALYKKKMALALADGAIALSDLLRFDDMELERKVEAEIGRAWWDELTHEGFTRICSAKLPRRHRVLPEDQLNTESSMLGKSGISAMTLAKYPRSLGFIIVPRRSADPRDDLPFLDVFVSAIGNPRRCSAIVEAVRVLSDLQSGRSGFITRQRLAQDVLGYLLNASVRVDYLRLAELMNAGFLTLSPGDRQRFVRRLYRHRDFFYYSFELSPFDSVEKWEDLIRSPHFALFLRDNYRYVMEILKASLHRAGKEFAQIVEAIIWIDESRRVKAPGWVLPNVIIELKNGTNQIDAASLFVKGRRTTLRFHECSKSDSEGKAIGDLQKLEKIRASAKRFDDLFIEQVVYGASGVRDHFSALQPLLDEYGIREKASRKPTS